MSFAPAFFGRAARETAARGFILKPPETLSETDGAAVPLGTYA